MSKSSLKQFPRGKKKLPDVFGKNSYKQFAWDALWGILMMPSLLLIVSVAAYVFFPEAVMYEKGVSATFEWTGFVDKLVFWFFCFVLSALSYASVKQFDDIKRRFLFCLASLGVCAVFVICV